VDWFSIALVLTDPREWNPDDRGMPWCNLGHFECATAGNALNIHTSLTCGYGWTLEVIVVGELFVDCGDGWTLEVIVVGELFVDCGDG